MKCVPLIDANVRILESAAQRETERERCLVHQPSCICCYLHSSIYTNQHIFLYTRSFAINDSKMTPIYFMQLFPFRTGWTRHTDRKGKTIQPFLRYTPKPASRSNCSVSLCCYYFVWPTPNSPPLLAARKPVGKTNLFSTDGNQLGQTRSLERGFYNLQALREAEAVAVGVAISVVG